MLTSQLLRIHDRIEHLVQAERLDLQSLRRKIPIGQQRHPPERAHSRKHLRHVRKQAQTRQVVAKCTEERLNEGSVGVLERALREYLLKQGSALSRPEQGDSVRGKFSSPNLYVRYSPLRSIR